MDTYNVAVAQRTNGHLDMTVNEADPEKGCCGGCRKGCDEFVVECGKLKSSIMQVNCKEYCSNLCTVDNIKRKVPISQWITKYRPKHLQGDIIAGLTVGLTVIPQGIAYAVIAELPPQYGLYSAFMGCIVYCFLGTSKDITLGPTAIMSLMTAIFATYQFSDEYSNLTETEKKRVTEVFNPIIAVLMTFFCGIVQTVMGIFHVGFLVEFIPHPVINSFTTAAAITIACGQIKTWLGLKKIPREFIHQMIETAKHVPETNIWDFVLGLVCMILLYGMKKIKEIKWRNNENVPICMLIIRKIIWLVSTARNAIVIAAATGLAYGLFAHDIKVFKLTGNIQPGLPSFQFPTLSYTFYNISASGQNITLTTKDIFSNIGAGFAIVPLIGLVETIAIGKAFARKNKYRIDANQELIAIGLSNTIGSFVSSYPVTGSFSRTAVNSQSGVRTPAGGIFTAILVILALALLTSIFVYIPNAALAGVIIMAVVDMIDFTMLKKLWRIKKIDLIPWFVTFILSFVLGIEYGIMIGVGVSLLMLLYPWARPKVDVKKEQYRPTVTGASVNAAVKEVLVIEFDSGLRFPGVEHLRQEVVDEATNQGELEVPRPVILDMIHVASLDFSTVHAIEELLEELTVNGGALVLSNVKTSVYTILERANIKNLSVYPTNQEAMNALNKEVLDMEVYDETTPLDHVDPNKPTAEIPVGV